MEKRLRRRVLGTLAVAGALALSGGPAMAAGPSAYTCSGGEVPSGTYASLTVTGMCSVAADAVISVVGNVNVAAGAMFDAQSAPSTITVGRNVTGAAGSLVGLGCQPPSLHRQLGARVSRRPGGPLRRSPSTGTSRVTDAAFVA